MHTLSMHRSAFFGFTAEPNQTEKSTEPHQNESIIINGVNILLFILMILKH